ncbi:hypothetical protein [Deinococcus pimensis]|uniref:hypothetical protein n=1 Tax=Deinococcus pimensis TaxID=309888 RepID=UPI000484C8EA|nr:hypothetical protein [Deinococcus pimensis]
MPLDPTKQLYIGLNKYGIIGPVRGNPSVYFVRKNGKLVRGRAANAEADAEAAVFDLRKGRESRKVASPIVIGTRRPRDPAQLPWHGTLNITSDSQLTDGSIPGSTVLTDGSVVITGRNYRSDTPGQPAVRIAAGITRKVTFRQGAMLGYGQNAGNGAIAMLYGHGSNNVRLEDQLHFSGQPGGGYDGALPAYAVCLVNGRGFEMVNSETYRTRGVFLSNWDSLNTNNSPTLRGVYQENVDGRRVDSLGNWRATNVLGQDYIAATFYQMADARSVRAPLIEYCRMYNDPVYGAQVEDVISHVHTACHPLYPGLVQLCLWENGLVYSPGFDGTQALYGAGADGWRRAYSGTLGNASDGVNWNAVARTADTMPSNMEFRDSWHLTGMNGGVSISSGNRNILRRCKVINVGYFRSKHPSGYTRIARINPSVGMTQPIIVWDQGPNSDPNYTRNDPAYWYGNIVDSCTVGWWDANADGTFQRSNGFFASPYTRQGADILLPTPTSIAAALQLIDDYRAEAVSALTSGGRVIGSAV